MNIPRLVVAGVSSGVGKTTAAVGLCRALRAGGLRVAMFKCGPDYLDPTYHQRAAGAVSHNLDGWLMGRAAVGRTFARAAAGADVAVIEGVMGLYDGASPDGDEGSTAEIAKWLAAPVLLVVDAGGMARSFAALAAGFRDFDPALSFAGLVANRVGSRGHLELLRKVQRNAPILGALPVCEALSFPERHLGLVTAAEDAVPEAKLDGWGHEVAAWWSLDAVLERARAAPPLPALPEEAAPTPPARRCRVGLARDEAFHFYYEDNLARLVALGAELVPFSPVHDRTLPEVDGLYLGGGYPEVHAAALAGNVDMRAAVAAFAARHRPIYAECGGLMYLAEAIRTRDGTDHPMAGVLPGTAVMGPRLEALGYVEVELQAPCPLGPAGTRFRGHEFRYSRLIGSDGSDAAEQVYRVRKRRTGLLFPEGYRRHNVVGSYVHAHWSSNPRIPAAFVQSCLAR